MATKRRRTLNAVLYAVVLLLLGGVILTGYQSYQLRADHAAETKTNEQRNEALAAANELVSSMLNISHETIQDDTQEVLDQSTGKFREQFQNGRASLTQLVSDEKSVQSGEVIWSGIQGGDSDSATVLVATKGTVANKASKGKERAVFYRFKVTLETVDGTWKTSALEPVA